MTTAYSNGDCLLFAKYVAERTGQSRTFTLRFVLDL